MVLGSTQLHSVFIWYSYTFRAHQDQKREWVITAIFLVRDQSNAIIISKVVACLLQLISWKLTGDLIQLLLWNNFPKPSWTIRAQALQGPYKLPFHRGFLSHCILNRALLSCSQASIQLFVGHLLDDRAFNVWWCCFSERDLLYYCTLSHCFFNKSGFSVWHPFYHCIHRFIHSMMVSWVVTVVTVVLLVLVLLKTQNRRMKKTIWDGGSIALTGQLIPHTSTQDNLGTQERLGHSHV